MPLSPSPSQCVSHSLPHPQVAASSGPRLAVWSLSGVSTRTWLVHSSLVLPDDKHITALDCRSGESALPLCPLYHYSLGAGLLAVTTRSTLSVYTLIMENDLPTWSCKWTRRCSIPESFIRSWLLIHGTDPHHYILYIFRHRWYISQPLWRYAYPITMHYFPFDRHSASESSWDNPDNIWSADTGHSPS